MGWTTIKEVLTKIICLTIMMSLFTYLRSFQAHINKVKLKKIMNILILKFWYKTSWTVIVTIVVNLTISKKFQISGER